MKWFYADQGQQIGPVEDADLDRLLSEGKITPSTLVWRDGLANWQLLSEARPAEPPPAPEAGGVRCDSCGNTFPPGDLITIEGRQICGACKPAFVQKLREGATLPDPVSVVRDGPAWEQRATLGFFKAIVETVKGVLRDPAKTFTRMKREGGLGTPLTYLIITGGGFGMVGMLYQILMHKLHILPEPKTGPNPFAAMAATSTMVVMMILMPALVAIGAFINAGIIHLCLMLLGGANRPFETTFRVICYATGSTAALQLVPFCGAYVAGIWNIVANSIGLARAHEITTGKAVAAVLLPIAVCCGAVFLVAILAGVAIAGAAKAGH